MTECDDFYGAVDFMRGHIIGTVDAVRTRRIEDAEDFVAQMNYDLANILFSIQDCERRKMTPEEPL